MRRDLRDRGARGFFGLPAAALGAVVGVAVLALGAGAAAWLGSAAAILAIAVLHRR